MLDQGSGMRISEHTDAGHKRDRLDRLLAEPMGRVTTDGNDMGSGHAMILAPLARSINDFGLPGCRR
jgi:hypothetical protein